MFFVLSKILVYLIMPLSVVFIFFLLSVFLKNPKWKKRMFFTALLLLYFFSNEFIANEAMRAWELPATPFSELKKYRVGIVLTGTTMSGLEPNDRVYSQRGADRVIHTVQLYKMGIIEKIIVSGGTGRLVDVEDPEANKYQKLMTMMGVKAEDIMLENQTRNTAESAPAVKIILEQQGYKPAECLLITSAFHMRRSRACYRKAGLGIDTFTTDFYSYPRTFYPDVLLVPQFESIMLWTKLFKEWVGMASYKVAGYI